MKTVKLIQQIEDQIWIGKHQIWIIDFDADDSNNYNDDAYDIGIGVAEGMIGMTDFNRAAGSLPVLIEHYETDPGIDDINDYSGVMEASIHVPSGNIAIESIDTKDIAFTVPPGIYCIRIYYGNEETCSYDDSNGANHARIILFPTTEKREIQLLKKKDTDESIKEYRGTRSESELLAMLTSTIISYRCIATIALLQLGKFDLVKTAIQNAPTSVKHVFTSALWIIGNDAIPMLAELAKSQDYIIRLRVVESLEILANNEALGILSTLSEDENENVLDAAAYAIAWINGAVS